MKACPSLDALISIEEALDWDAESALRHIVTCEACVAEIRQVEGLHQALDKTLEPSAGFADRVLGSLAPSPAPQLPADESGGRLLSVGIFVLATLTALLTLSTVPLATYGAGGLGSELLAFAGLVGIAALKLTPRMR